ncbi:MAG: S41 family peptidase [Candidatus Promineifilaceae bacterium]|jgi:carboxyl-terminal processing protease
MKSRVLLLIVILFALFLAFNGGYVLAQSPLAPYHVFPASFPTGENGDLFAPFWEAVNLVETRYYNQPVDQNALVEGAITGMLETLDDPHTIYLSPELEAAQREEFEGDQEIQGIGAEVSQDGDNIVIVSPIDGSPAAAAGLRPGDILREANGVDLTGMSAAEAAAVVRGPQGTDVILLIERDGETFEVTVTRDVIKIKSVQGRMLDDNLAYLRISQFGLQTDEDLDQTLKELMAQNPVGLILDLRLNPGGGLDTVVTIADEFLPDGAVLYQEFGDEVEREFTSKTGDIAEEIPMVVLIDEGSASASEVLAGAIRDHDRGVLIGHTSYGKGTVQSWLPLSNGGGLRLTIARWLTPNHNWVNREGLEPDYRVDLPEFDASQEFVDTQLQAAIDYLLGKPVIESPPAAEES